MVSLPLEASQDGIIGHLKAQTHQLQHLLGKHTPGTSGIPASQASKPQLNRYRRTLGGYISRERGEYQLCLELDGVLQAGQMPRSGPAAETIHSHPTRSTHRASTPGAGAPAIDFVIPRVPLVGRPVYRRHSHRE